MWDSRSHDPGSNPGRSININLKILDQTFVFDYTREYVKAVLSRARYPILMIELSEVRGSNPGRSTKLKVRCSEPRDRALSGDEAYFKLAANMDEWRSIDYNERLKQELRLLEKSPIREEGKKLILRYKSWRLANGVSVARTHREMLSQRLLCQQFGFKLDDVGEDSLIDVLAAIETTSLKLNTKNEYKRDLRLFLKM